MSKILSMTGSRSAEQTRKPDPVPLIDLTEQFEAIQGEIFEAVERVLKSQKFVLGEEVAEFEQMMAEDCDARFAIGCASGTDALLLALAALDIGPGDEVITTPFTFFATASAISRVGAKPVFVDIDPITYNLDTEKVAAAVTEHTKAILPVHLFGRCVDMEPLWRLAVRHGLAIVEDAAQAIGATYRGRKAGVLGTIGCFSFFPTKNLGGAGDGGMMTTDDANVARRLQRLRVHGDVGRYEHKEIGMNSRLDALQAAVLKVKMRHLADWTHLRQENAARYQTRLGKMGFDEDLELPASSEDYGHVYNQYCVRVKNGHRDELIESLNLRQVGCAVYYPKPLHLQDCFAHLGYKAGDFPEAERAAAEILALPIYPELGVARQERVLEAIDDSMHAIRNSVIPASRTIRWNNGERRAA